MTEAVLLMLVGAGIVLLMVVLVVAAVALLLHRHELREIGQNSARHAALLDEMDGLRKLTLRSIAGRGELERRVDLHSGEIDELKARLDQMDQEAA